MHFASRDPRATVDDRDRNDFEAVVAFDRQRHMVEGPRPARLGVEKRVTRADAVPALVAVNHKPGQFGVLHAPGESDLDRIALRIVAGCFFEVDRAELHVGGEQLPGFQRFEASRPAAVSIEQPGGAGLAARCLTVRTTLITLATE